MVRFSVEGSGPAVPGVERDGRVARLDMPTMAAVLRLSGAELAEAVAGVSWDDAVDVDAARLHAPVDGRTTVWAAGVTYTISRDARVEESEVEDVYMKVYDAERPELFFKAAAQDVMTDGDPVGRRDDSTNDTPEPELGLVVNPAGEIVAYTAVNDMSSRSIEGENPLYLPQAKMFAGSCVVAPTLRLAGEVLDPLDLSISMQIQRGDETVFDGEANTGRLHRSPQELVDYLFRSMTFPDGVVLSTGTCLVPDLSAPVVDGDVVSISVDGVGAMTNVVTPTSVLMGR